MTTPRRRTLLALPLLALSACADAPDATGDGGPSRDAPAAPGSPADPPEPAGSVPDAAPWAGPPLAPGAVPDVLLAEWSRAENRGSCALVAPAGTGPAEATPRAAAFGGGWGVAWDLPGQRSAFGVAGTGVEPDDDTYDDWPYRTTWQDGSRVGYGPEGGDGPNQLAYLRIDGEGCLYNVWSRLGRRHLEGLLASLRFVDTGEAEAP